MTAEARPVGRGQGRGQLSRAVPDTKAPVFLTLLVPSSSNQSRARDVPSGHGTGGCNNFPLHPRPTRRSGRRQAVPTRIWSSPLCPSGTLDTVPLLPPKVKVDVFWLTQNHRDKFLGKNVLFISLLFTRVLETHLYCQALRRSKCSEGKTASELGRNQQKASREKHVHPFVCLLILG